MLGVRREGVSEAASELQAHSGLEANSCECYEIIKAETDSYLN
jgi:hypothetical protein